MLKQKRANKAPQDPSAISSGYKQTEIGLIPEDWAVAPLGSIANLERGKFAHRPRNEPRFYGGDIPFIQTGDIGQANGLVRRYTQTLNNAGLKISKLFGKGTIAITIAANIGDVAILGFDSCFPDSIVGINTGEAADTEFLMYLLKSYKRKLDLIAPQSAQKNINLKTLEQLKVPLPPRSEQQSISNILASVDQAIERTSTVINQTKVFKQALMQQLLTRGIPGWHKEFKDSPIGKIPGTWKMVELNEIVSQSFNGGTPSTKKSNYWDGPIPWTTSAIISEPDIYLTRFQRGITEAGLNGSATAIAPRGSLILGTRVGVGKAVVAGFDTAVSQDITVLKLKRNIVPTYLAFLFKLPAINRALLSKQRGTSIKGVTRADVLSIKIPLPSLSEQQKIVELLLAITMKADQETALVKPLDTLKQSLMQNLLTGKIRVNGESS